MPGIWSRHPKYFIFVLVVLGTTFYLLNPLSPEPQFKRLSFPYDLELPGRLERAETIYKKLLDDRRGLIKKFGPTPADVQMFPADKDPWPAYTVWDFFPAAYNCPHDIQRLGALGDGGKWVCGITRIENKQDCVVYSFGINHESSFEAEILANTNHCEIWGYDFTVHSFGPQITKSQEHRTHFYPYKLGGSNKPAVGDEPAMFTLSSLMKTNGHSHIDILKVDIESWEFETLTTLIKSYTSAGLPLPFGQLQLEIHAWNKSFEEFLSWWEMLEDAGLRPFWTEPNLVYQNYNRGATVDLAEYSFLNVKGDNVFIRDPPRTSAERKHDV
ncbi:hypothetical protein E1B28_003415 [Marasmius oreades]|uniref:Methyltransferase domain-containing protein n=1 Tax=Marasmius oreades TaxID=181124 RepID=A0A9P7RMG1_9AGAR|nr:uncharacterized protein E1B28_003415 [Marasmius oreades]KAG7085881.1 hypothetical protein E1B28_003415 [Marasmius oreades]